MVIHHPVFSVIAGRPNRRTAHSLGLFFAGTFGGSERQIKIVENPKKFVDRFSAGGRDTRGLGGCNGTNEARRRSIVARQTDHPAATTERFEVELADLLSGQGYGRKIDVISQIGLVPVVSWSVGEHAEGSIKNLHLTFQEFNNDGFTARLGDEVMQGRREPNRRFHHWHHQNFRQHSPRFLDRGAL